MHNESAVVNHQTVLWAPEDDVYVSASSIAERVFAGELSEESIWRFARKGVIPYVKIQGIGMRFHVGAVKQALRERMVQRVR